MGATGDPDWRRKHCVVGVKFKETLRDGEDDTYYGNFIVKGRDMWYLGK